jgi:hypothetical protein
MKVIKGVVNDVSDKLLPKKLNRGEVVTYELLTDIQTQSKNKGKHAR